MRFLIENTSYIDKDTSLRSCPPTISSNKTCENKFVIHTFDNPLTNFDGGKNKTSHTRG